MEAQTTTYGADRLELLRATGRNLWLAGLGAVGTIADLDRQSRGLFDRLVERGRPLEARQKRSVDELGDRANHKIREVRELVRDQVRYDVKQVLTRVGLPTAEDFSLLAARLETLSLKIDEFAQGTEAPGLIRIER